MRKKQTAAVLALAGALTVGGAFAAFAANQGTGQWCNGADGVAADTTWKNADGQTVSSWWFAVSADGKQSLANTWHWIKAADGNMYCYYFDKDGWMVVDGTVDGSRIDPNGRFEQNGALVKGDENKTYYTASETFLQTAQSGNQAAAGSNGSSTAPAGGAASGSASNANSGDAKTGHVKVTGSKGDQPDNVSTDFQISQVEGSATKTVTNSWANFRLSLNGLGTFDGGDGNSNMDFRASSDDAELSVQYYPIDYYKAGNTSLDAFVQSYMNAKKPGALENGVKGVKLGEDKSFGGYTYKQVVRTFGIPIGKTIDYSTYLRQVEGTNYVMEIYTKGSPDSFAGLLGSMQKVR